MTAACRVMSVERWSRPESNEVFLAQRFSRGAYGAVRAFGLRGTTAVWSDAPSLASNGAMPSRLYVCTPGGCGASDIWGGCEHGRSRHRAKRGRCARASLVVIAQAVFAQRACSMWVVLTTLPPAAHPV